ncbi:MAG: HD domain-containing protein [Amoebophilaceae bacterium]|nr:HD domain-containing protein [Amoebophilaceae bacterium]
MYIDPVFFFVGLFLLICLISGFGAGRKTKTFQQFAVGDKNFSVTTLVATIVGTQVGGGLLFRNLEHIYTYGLYFAIPTLLSPLQFLFMSRFMALRMGEFMHHLSIAESMGSIFGKTVRLITALSGILFSIGVVAMQLNVISRIIKLCCKIEGNTPIYIAVGVVLLYSIFGGIRAVTFTDVIQFVTFNTLIPVLLYLVGRHTTCETLCSVFTTHPAFDVTKVVGLHPQFRNTLLLMFMFLLPSLQPSIIQRVYTARNVWQLRSAFTYTSIIGLLILGIISFLAVALRAHDADLNPARLIDHILEMYNFIWLKSFVCMGVLALAMSTADSNLHVAAVLFTYDLPTVLGWKIKNKFILIYPFSCVMVLVALQLAFYKQDLLDLLMLCAGFYGPIVTVPFMMAVLGFRPATKSVLLGMGFGMLTIIACKSGLLSCLNIKYDVPLAMLISLLFLVGSHYLLPTVPGTGWIGIKDTIPLTLEKQKRASRKAALKEAFKNFRLTRYLKELIPQKEVTFVFMGLYVNFIQIIRLYTAPKEMNLFLWMTTTGLAVLLLLYPTLKKRGNTFLGELLVYSYPLVIFLILFVSGSYMLYIHNYGSLAIMVFLINILVGILLLPWKMILGMVVLALTNMHYMVPSKHCAWEIIIKEWNGEWGRFICTILSFVVVYIIMQYWKINKQKDALKITYLSKDIETYLRDQVKHLQYHYHADRLAYKDGSKERIIAEITNKLELIARDSNILEEIKKHINHLVDRLKGYKQFIEESRYIRAYHLCLEHKMVDIQEIINSLIKKVNTLEQPIKLICHNYTSRSTLCADPVKLEQMLLNALYYILTSAVDKVAHLYILDTSIEYMLNKAENFTKNLPALSFSFSTTPAPPIIEAVYKESLDDKKYTVPKDTHELYRYFLIRIVNAHYGCLVEMPLAITCILPVDLDEIRDQVMNYIPPYPYLPVAETESSIAQEKELETLLVRETTLTSRLIQETIEFIKLCHGDQVRASGEPYYIHPIAVAMLLLQETKDSTAILAALLHDVVEDSKIPLSYIQSKYGAEVATIVATVTHMGASFRKKKLNKTESQEQLRKFKDIRAVQVKIADRFHNVLTLKHRPLDKQVKVAKQTLAFYICFAESVGVNKLTKELRKLCEDILAKYEETILE